MPLTTQQIQAIALQQSGLSQTEIAAKIGITPRTLQRWQHLPEYQEATQATTQAATQADFTTTTKKVVQNFNYRDVLRQKEVCLLDKLQDGLEGLLEADPCNFRAIDALLKISERRSKLFGLEIKSIPLLDAMNLLMIEGVATPEQANIISTGIAKIENDLSGG